MNLTLEEVNFSDVIMNSYSPRLPKSMNGKNIEELIPYFLFNEALSPLVGSLSVLGWFPTEPIILQKMYDNTYTVIDGNRRIAACWLMLNTKNYLCPDFIKEIVNEMDEDKIKNLNTLTAFIKN